MVKGRGAPFGSSASGMCNSLMVCTVLDGLEVVPPAQSLPELKRAENRVGDGRRVKEGVGTLCRVLVCLPGRSYERQRVRVVFASDLSESENL